MRTVQSDSMFFPNRWTHVAAIYKAPQLQLFQDGNLVGTETEGSASDTPEIDFEHGIALGSNPETENVPDDRGITGFVDEFILYDDAVTESEILNIYAGNLASVPAVVDAERPLFKLPQWLDDPEIGVAMGKWKRVEFGHPNVLQTLSWTEMHNFVRFRTFDSTPVALPRGRDSNGAFSTVEDDVYFLIEGSLTGNTIPGLNSRYMAVALGWQNIDFTRMYWFVFCY